MLVSTTKESLYLPTVSSCFRAVFAVFVHRIKTISRYKGNLLLDITMPVLFAFIPILLGTAVAGSPQQAAVNFSRNAGTTNYQLYLIFGAITLGSIMTAMWTFSNWIRREMVTGTLESIYLVPTSRLLILLGVSMYVAVRETIIFFCSLVLSLLIFRIDPFFVIARLPLMMVFYLSGIFATFGLALTFGALILHVKQAGSLISLLQWVIMFLTGVLYPITMLPLLLQVISLLFPPTWQLNGMRASALDSPWFLGTPLSDFTAMIFMAAGFTLLGMTLFSYMERRLKRNEGIGTY